MEYAGYLGLNAPTSAVAEPMTTNSPRTGPRTKFKESFDRFLWLLDRVRDEVPESQRSARMAIAHLCDLETYLQKNASGMISYREWRNAGKRISTSAVEGTVNRPVVDLENTARESQQTAFV
jgi:hypothetical protein